MGVSFVNNKLFDTKVGNKSAATFLLENHRLLAEKIEVNSEEEELEEEEEVKEDSIEKDNRGTTMENFTTTLQNVVSQLESSIASVYKAIQDNNELTFHRVGHALKEIESSLISKFDSLQVQSSKGKQSVAFTKSEDLTEYNVAVPALASSGSVDLSRMAPEDALYLGSNNSRLQVTSSSSDSSKMNSSSSNTMEDTLVTLQNQVSKELPFPTENDKDKLFVISGSDLLKSHSLDELRWAFKRMDRK